MQKDWNEEDLLGNAQGELDEICRPALNKPANPAMTPGVARSMLSARVGFVLQKLLLSTKSELAASQMDVDTIPGGGGNE